jgi:hypothetical protein
MKKSVLVLVMVLLTALVAAASDVPRMETFLGYTYVRMSSGTNAPSFGANGGSGQFAYNFNHWLSAVVDAGGTYNNAIGQQLVNNTIVNYLAGPRLSLRHSRFRLYGQVLFGGATARTSARLNAVPNDPSQPIFLPGQGTLPVIPGQPITVRLVAAQTDFAMTAGGGIDLKINKYLSFRPIGLDYFMTRFQNYRTPGDNNQGSLRYTAGVNFTFGKQ